MRRLVALLLVSMLSLSVSAASSGENQSPSPEELEEAGMLQPWHTGVVIDGSHLEVQPFDARNDFEMYVWVENNSNVSSIEWITQVCINTGVCFAPETNEMELDELAEGVNMDNPRYHFNIDIDDTASYINWKFVLHHENGSQTDVPSEGFGWKVWSNCWWDNGTWGGSSTHCQEEAESLDFRPSWIWYAMMVLPVVAVAIAMVALKEARRD